MLTALTLLAVAQLPLGRVDAKDGMRTYSSLQSGAAVYMNVGEKIRVQLRKPSSVGSLDLTAPTGVELTGSQLSGNQASITLLGTEPGSGTISVHMKSGTRTVKTITLNATVYLSRTDSTLTSAQNGKTIDLRNGTEFTIALPSNPSTGYAWRRLNMKSDDPWSVRGPKYIADSDSEDRVGAGGATHYMVKAQRHDTRRIWFGLISPSGKIERRFSVTLRIH